MTHTGREDGEWFVRLLGGFELRGPSGPVEATPGVQRLLAFIALQGGALPRSRAAGALWPSVHVAQAGANLRSTLWRTRQLGPLVRAGGNTLRLGLAVTVDVHRLVPSRASMSLADGQPLRGLSNLELLPEWTEDWVTVERERLRHLELHYLDDEVAALASGGRVPEALDTALRAIRLEPLRESSHQALIRIFLQSGNRSAAVSHYHGYVSLLREELDLGPDPVTTALVAPLLSTRSGRTGPGRNGGNRPRRAGPPAQRGP